MTEDWGISLSKCSSFIMLLEHLFSKIEERRRPLEDYQKKIKEKLNVVPLEPGCYLMKDRNAQVIYVGKAKKLRNRLRSYFTGAHDAKTTRLVSEIRNFEFIVTSSETESLLLELNLIKQYQPRYNILLKDDKSYPFIKITKRSIRVL